MSTPTTERPVPARPRRRLWYAAASAALVAVVAIGGITLFNGDDAVDDTTTTVPGVPPAALELDLGDGGAMASCLPVSADILKDMSPAFLGTVQTVEGERVTLAVDRWYAGGGASLVALHAPAGMEALIGGIDFQVGQQYFVTAFDGVVNYCGYSDAYSPELAAIYDEAFGA